MQGLSSRAHAFSVEALVGKPYKRMKVSEMQESSSAADTGIFHGQAEHTASQMTAAGSSPWRPAEKPGQQPAESGTEESERGVQAELQGSELWKRFYEIGTEMIITKAGRRMFPSVRVKVRNLEPCQQYYVAMDVMPVDSKRYRYVYHSSQWMVAGNTDHSCISPRLYVHPDSPSSGETWMRQVISFDRVKLTNNEMDDKGHIILQSMHKYKPRVHIIRYDARMDASQIQALPAEGVHTFSFPETEFTTVTAYQNQQITKLKIDRNPFAKGFRDPGRNRGVLDGLLESYPWRGPLNLDLKPFSIQLQGSSPSPSSGVKNYLPLSSSSALLPLSCPDSALHALTLPLFGKTSTDSPSVSTLPSRVLSSLGADRLRNIPSVPPLADLPFFSALQGKKALNCRDQCLHRSPGSSSCLIQLHTPLSPQRSSLPPHLADTMAPYCLYGYSFPLSPRLTALSRDGKLSENTDYLLWHPAWQQTSNHCL
ncbi:T-box transcription factor TBX22 [Cyprinodon tularosa]|uniref:T-box transcription factor TBX22 n=1 Tax=Cyprinodon tularosa TaxID=77115 RepID=UPI0018E27446|nr:T-box transcription factor TBX22 [Cyprinodon tularosa]